MTFGMGVSLLLSLVAADALSLYAILCQVYLLSLTVQVLWRWMDFY